MELRKSLWRFDSERENLENLKSAVAGRDFNNRAGAVLAQKCKCSLQESSKVRLFSGDLGDLKSAFTVRGFISRDGDVLDHKIECGHGTRLHQSRPCRIQS